MASLSELSARAALCRELAKREPKNRVFWMAEAESWSRLSNENFRGEPEQTRLPHLGKFAGAFHKIVVTLIANDDAAVRVKPPILWVANWRLWHKSPLWCSLA
jgi:hypothetical protein